MKALALICLFAATLAHAQKGVDAEISRQQKELAELRQQLEAERRSIETLKKRQTGAQERLDQISLSIDLAEQVLRKMAATEGNLHKSVAETRDDLKTLERRIADRREVMSNRVRGLYIRGKPENLLFSGWKPGEGDFLQRIFFMRKLLDHDRSLVAANEKDMRQREAQLAELDRKLADLTQIKEAKSQELNLRSQSRKEQEVVYTQLQSSVASKSQALKKMEENARLLTEILRKLEKRRQEQLAKDKQKKPSVLATGQKYCLPAEGEIVSQFGLQYHKVLKTTTKNLGIEIAAVPGTAVKAAVTGEVALVTDIPGYGPGIILDNGSGYFTIYANLAGVKVKQGDKVTTCQELASAPPGQPRGRVYFEVRQGTKTLDPIPWLKQ